MRKFSICFLANILEKVRKKSRNHDLLKCGQESTFDILACSHRGIRYNLTAIKREYFRENSYQISKNVKRGRPPFVALGC